MVSNTFRKSLVLNLGRGMLCTHNAFRVNTLHICFKSQVLRLFCMQPNELVDIVRHYSNMCGQRNWGFYLTDSAKVVYEHFCSLTGDKPVKYEVYGKIKQARVKKFDKEKVKDVS